MLNYYEIKKKIPYNNIYYEINNKKSLNKI